MIVHERIVELIRERQKDLQDPTIAAAINGFDNDTLIRALFYNFRGKHTEARGMRLTTLGHTIMTTCFDHYKIHLPNTDVLSSRQIIHMDRVCKMPWHFAYRSNVMTLFEKELAFRLKLVGDLQVFVDNFA